MIEVNASEIVTVDKMSGVGPATVTLTASANPVAEERMGKIKVKTGEQEINVTVLQKAGNVVVIPEFDYLVLRYSWSDSDGKDFDTATGFLDTGMSDVDGKFVGWSLGYETTSMQVGNYIIHGGDNMSSGKEAALINMRELLSAPGLNENEPSVSAVIYGNWYEELGRGDVEVSFTAYLGGEMKKGNFNFTNEGGEEVYTGSVKVNVKSTGATNYQNIKQLYTRIGTMVYDKAERDCVIFIG